MGEGAHEKIVLHVPTTERHVRLRNLVTDKYDALQARMACARKQSGHTQDRARYRRWAYRYRKMRSGLATRSEVINGFLRLYQRPRYLEVGVSAGETFFAVSADRKVAVDPHFRFSVADAQGRQPEASFHAVPSDA
jgi:hypothetical protein